MDKPVFTPQSVICVVAHPDDLELMAGGTIASWIASGSRVNVLSLSDGSWVAPDGKLMRDQQEAFDEENAAAQFLGYQVENLGLPAMNLRYEDRLVVEVLRRVDTYRPDLLICPWERDSHHDHEIASRIAMAASRRIPCILMGQINYYLRDIFTPNMFVDITNTWEKKLHSLECYAKQWERAGQDWFEYLDITTRYYGKMIGVKRAEGFVTRKFLL